MAARIKALGSPAVSALLDLPIQRGGVDAKFGLDLQPLLARIAGPKQPGTYLVGLRAVTAPTRTGCACRSPTSSLTTVEEADRVRFAVTSLATAQPVAGAEIRLEGLRDERIRRPWRTASPAPTAAGRCRAAADGARRHEPRCAASW